MKSQTLIPFRFLPAILLLAVTTTCSQNPAVQSSATNQTPYTPRAYNYKITRFSGLSEINTGNVNNLKLAWEFSTGVVRGHEAAPLVVNNTMYVVTPYPNILYALNLTKNGAVKWKYEPKPAPQSQGVACCDVVNRGAVYQTEGSFTTHSTTSPSPSTPRTGRRSGKISLGNINKGETMAPLVVKDKVLAGNSGGELGVRGWLTALDALPTFANRIIYPAYAGSRFLDFKACVY